MPDPMIFGIAPEGVICHPRPAAYVVVRGAAGRVAVVRVGERCWLPGGGARPGEAPEDTVRREVREELGRSVEFLRPLGEAIQYFFSANDAKWYAMTAVFFQGRFDGEAVAPAEHSLHWLDAERDGRSFFHACHAWAAALADTGDDR